MSQPQSDGQLNVLYPRVSTLQQRTESQLEDLRRWAAAQKGPVEWIEDKFTGRTMKRPGMERLLKLVRAGKVKQIVVWRLDRLGRSAAELLQLLDELQARGVGLISLREGLDFGTPAGRMVAGVLASLAQWETEGRAERVAEGIAAAKRAGKQWGGSKKGWRWKVTDEQVETVVRLSEEGKGASYIARVTGLSRQTVYNLLQAGSGEE